MRFFAKKIATVGKNTGSKNRLSGALYVAVLSVMLSGCEGQTQSGDQGPQISADSADHEQELAIVSPPAPEAPSAARITNAQRRLSALGYNVGPIDGVLGKQTIIAIKHFQVDAGVNVNGELTPSLASRLKEEYAKQQGREAQASRQNEDPAEAGGGTSRYIESAGPSYEVGDIYVYSDGQIETVSRVGPERTLWESAQGSVYTAYRNFILPPISWKSGGASVENQVQPAGARKWPLATTGDVVFSVSSKASGGSVDAPGSWAGKWRCAATGVTPVKVMIGPFDAVVIECQRAAPEPGTWKKRTWYYVPEVGHYVRRIDLIHGTGRKRTVDLIAVRPGGKGWPPAARGGLDWAIQSALDAGNYNDVIEWRSSAVGAMFTIRVMGNVPVTGKADCRRYRVERSGSDQLKLFPAIACKKPGGERWLTPGLDPGSVSPKSLKR